MTSVSPSVANRCPCAINYRELRRGLIAVVVDLAVEDDDLRLVFVEDRLSSARQIDDAEPSHPEADVAVHVGALVVRPPMTNRLAHPPNHGRRNGPGRV